MPTSPTALPPIRAAARWRTRRTSCTRSRSAPTPGRPCCSPRCRRAQPRSPPPGSRPDTSPASSRSTPSAPSSWCRPWPSSCSAPASPSGTTCPAWYWSARPPRRCHPPSRQPWPPRSRTPPSPTRTPRPRRRRRTAAAGRRGRGLAAVPHHAAGVLRRPCGHRGGFPGRLGAHGRPGLPRRRGLPLPGRPGQRRRQVGRVQGGDAAGRVRAPRTPRHRGSRGAGRAASRAGQRRRGGGCPARRPVDPDAARLPDRTAGRPRASRADPAAPVPAAKPGRQGPQARATHPVHRRGGRTMTTSLAAPSTTGGRLPASFAQHGIWVTERTVGGGSTYHLPLTIRFDGDLVVPALVEACRAVFDRHRVLNTAVAEHDGDIWLVPADGEPAVERLAADASELDEVLRRAVTRRFDLRRGPLARFTLVAVSPRVHVLLFVAHHLVFDGMSKDVLVAELAADYRALVCCGAAAPADPQLPASYAAHLAAERDRVAALRCEAEAFWATRWREPSAPVLPSAGPAAAAGGISGVAASGGSGVE